MEFNLCRIGNGNSRATQYHCVEQSITRARAKGVYTSSTIA
jgi:hypothetical protein